MKSKTTLVLLALVLGLGGFYLLHTARQPSARQAEEQRDWVFPAREFEHPRAPTNPGLATMATNLEIRGGDEKVALVREVNGTDPGWRIAEPVRARADDGAVFGLLTELEFLTTARVLVSKEEAPLDLAAYGLKPPRYVLIFGFAGRFWTLNVGDRTADGGRMYVARPDEPDRVYVASTELLPRLTCDVEDFRDKTVLRFNPDKVARLAFSSEGEAGVLLSGGSGGWRMIEPFEDEANPEAVRRLLGALQAMRIGRGDFVADEVEDLAPYGLDAPTFRLTLVQDETLRGLLVGAKAPGAPGKRYAMRSGPGSPIFALADSAVEALRLSPEALRSGAALEFNTGEVTGLTLEVAGETTRIETAGGEWTMRPDGAAADPDSVKLILSDLANLRVEKWLDAPDDALLTKAGLLSPRMTVTLTVGPAAPREIGLRIGDKADRPEWTYARRGDGGPVLLISSDLPRKLAGGRLAFLSRRILEVPPERIVGVEVRRGGKAVLARKGEGGWLVNENPTDPTDRSDRTDGVDRAAVEELTWTLSWLEGTQVVADRPADLAAYGLDAPWMTIVVEFETDDPQVTEKRTLRVGEPFENGAAYAMMEGEDRVVVLPKGAVRRLAAEWVAPEAKAEESKEEQP